MTSAAFQCEQLKRNLRIFEGRYVEAESQIEDNSEDEDPIGVVIMGPRDAIIAQHLLNMLLKTSRKDVSSTIFANFALPRIRSSLFLSCK